MSKLLGGPLTMKRVLALSDKPGPSPFGRKRFVCAVKGCGITFTSYAGMRRDYGNGVGICPEHNERKPANV